MLVSYTHVQPKKKLQKVMTPLAPIAREILPNNISILPTPLGSSHSRVLTVNAITVTRSLTELLNTADYNRTKCRIVRGGR